MKLLRIAALLTGVVALGACDESGTDPVLAPSVSLAYTRFINAVGDTGAVDMRFIDRIDYTPIGLGIAFRSFSSYQGTAAGQRQFRIFPTSTDINVTSAFLKDTTFTLEAGKYYSIIYSGYARTGSTPSHRIIVMEDPIPATVASTEFATRFVHLGSGLAAQDAYALASATTAISGTPMFTNVAYGTSSAYGTRAVGAMAFRATNTGTTTVTASALAPAGVAADATNNLNAIAGTGQGGSVFTGYYFPRSVAGSSAPQTTAFQSPAIIYLYDRHPQ